jgi:hypothetical protein
VLGLERRGRGDGVVTRIVVSIARMLLCLSSALDRLLEEPEDVAGDGPFKAALDLPIGLALRAASLGIGTGRWRRAGGGRGRSYASPG